MVENGAVDEIKRNDKIVKNSYHNAQKHHELFLPALNFRHYGEFPFKNSLFTGVLFRDPTRDKRMVEFAKSIPFDQFTHNGYTRRLIREYMEEYMPPEFFVKHPFGIQSADMKFVFEKDGDRIIDEWKSIVSSLDDKGVVDKARLLDDLDTKSMKDFSYVEIMRLFYSINALEYINNY